MWSTVQGKELRKAMCACRLNARCCKQYSKWEQTQTCHRTHHSSRSPHASHQVPITVGVLDCSFACRRQAKWQGRESLKFCQHWNAQDTPQLAVEHLVVSLSSRFPLMFSSAGQVDVKFSSHCPRRTCNTLHSFVAWRWQRIPHEAH